MKAWSQHFRKTALPGSLQSAPAQVRQFLTTAFDVVRRSQEQRQLTHENVQRKQARTGEEREEEEEEQLSESESEDEDNEIIYNPKNLPLGWDGKVRTHSCKEYHKYSSQDDVEETK